MADTIRRLSGAASAYKGFVEGQDAEVARQRARVLRTREDERYGHEKAGRERAGEKAGLEHGKFKREFEEEEGARETAAGAGAEAAAPATPTTSRPLSAVGGAPQEQAPAQPATQPTTALWLRQAEAQRDYWIKKGRPERGQKVMTDAINARIAEQEALHKFETQPQMEAMRRRGLEAQELEQDLNFRNLRLKSAEADITSAGLMWGHMLSGNLRAAINAFNGSGVTLPGVKVADVGQSPDGTKIYLLDEQGRIVKDRNGKDLAYPRQLLDNLWRRASTATATVKKGETIVQSRTRPTGELSVTPVFTSEDPTERRLSEGAARDTDAKWATVLNSARDDAHRYLKDVLGLTANALGQVMKPENQPLFERAQPIVETEIQKFRGSGKRLDQVTATDVAKKALAQARDELAREQAGAGSPNPNAPAGGGPTWRDVLQ